VTQLPPVPGAESGTDPAAGRWLRVELRAEDLGWLPSVLASLDLPFVIEQPEELRDLVIGLADRLAARAATPAHDAGAGTRPAG
jgi:hypothetical protein